MLAMPQQRAGMRWRPLWAAPAQPTVPASCCRRFPSYSLRAPLRGAPTCAPALPNPPAAAVLLTLPELWTNWDEALASPACQASPGADWSSASMPCGSGGAQAWRGVTCDADGHVSGM